METLQEKHVEILNDLLKVNNDRIEGYERAIKDTKDEDSDLKSIFQSMIDDTRTYNNELTQHIQSHGGDVETGTTAGGAIHRAWIDLKTTFTGSDRKSILESCEFGEDASQKAYKTALEDEDLTGECRALVSQQQQSLKVSHDKIKALRDAQR